MKEIQELEEATERRSVARAAFTQTRENVRARLKPRLLAAELAELVAARAGAVMVKRGITRRHRAIAAVSGAAALASAIVLRASHRAAAKIKKGNDPDKK